MCGVGYAMRPQNLVLGMSELLHIFNGKPDAQAEKREIASRFSEYAANIVGAEIAVRHFSGVL